MVKLTDEEIMIEARRRVRLKRGFYSHLVTYLIVNTFLVLIWAFPAGRGYPWPLWVLGGWGIGVVSNFVHVFVFSSGSRWAAEEREAEKIRRQNQ